MNNIPDLREKLAKYEDYMIKNFTDFVKIDTQSNEECKKIPSSPGQKELAGILEDIINNMGIGRSERDEKGFLYVYIPENTDIKIEPLFFMAHLDTAPSVSGNNVRPRIHIYRGGSIHIGEGLNLNPEEDPDLTEYVNGKIITASGDTLLGADDKAGIAEIITALKYLAEHSDYKHGPITIIFTPDEEIGRGIKHIDIKKIKAEFGYTVDGGRRGEIETECFNAANCVLRIKGYNVHPGYAYGKMINAVRIAGKLLAYFPDDEAPETTKDRKGYYHPYSINGDTSYTELKFIIRDFDAKNLEKRISMIKRAVTETEKQFTGSTVEMDVEKVYENMKKYIDTKPFVKEYPINVMKILGIKPIEKAIRGGTDGAYLSAAGIPTPNLFTGGRNFHSKKEWIPVEDMLDATAVILGIIHLHYQNRKSRDKKE